MKVRHNLVGPLMTSMARDVGSDINGWQPNYSLAKRNCKRSPTSKEAGLFLLRSFPFANSIIVDMDELLSRITIDPGKCGGKPCIRGMRMRVSDVLELLGAGAPPEEILRDYPYLEHADILAAIQYAAHQTDHVVLRTA
jgi:uncharacterized protein (DUF433 family)